MFTLRLTVRGRAIEPSGHASFNELGDALADALREADLTLSPRALAVLLSLMYRDLSTRPSWAWVAEDYEIYVTRERLQTS